MSDPLLDAVKALRETSSGEESALGRYTRSRVLSAVRLHKRRRVLNVTFSLPLAAILVGTGAWATARSFPLFVQRVSVVLGLREPPSVTAVLTLPKTASKALTAKSSEPPEVETDSELPSETTHENLVDSDEVESESERPREANEESQRGSGVVANSKPVSSTARDSHLTERELLLYESAHRTHFVDKDAQSALVAWDKYLEDSPLGRFSIEAAYNRGLCLVRLGRHDEARKALEPFARGAFGDYRKTEAQALIEQLASESP